MQCIVKGDTCSDGADNIIHDDQTKGEGEMTNCKICGDDKNLICTCGFCEDCLKEFGHDGCNELLNQYKKNDKQQTDHS